jgi:regulator of replication initiation timing
MDTKAKFDLMQKVARELGDLKNSQEAIIKKVAQIEAHNIELSDNSLDDVLSEIHESIANNLAKVEETALAFEEKTSQFAVDNSGALAAV